MTKIGAVMPNSLCGSQLEGGRNDTQLVLWIVVGGIAGLLADAVVRRISVGLVGAIVVGILGAFIGGALGAAVGMGINALRRK
jgi:uncharacterized membrane protein YeaQ/YmgE (transglycosylase-associated protein family)